MSSKRLSPHVQRSLGLVFTSIGVLAGLFLASRYSYLLFHTLAEGFSIVVAGAMFVLAWNMWTFTDNGYLPVLGVGFLFVGGLDLLHTMTYPGLDIIPGTGSDQSAQLWIAARYLQGISLLVAPTFLRRRVNRHVILSIYMVLFIILLGSIFGGIFPDSYVEGEGLTAFKVASEVVISALLGLAILRLFRQQETLGQKVFRWMVAAIGLSIASELVFTFYAGAYAMPNFVGHVLKIGAFYFIYRAVVQTGLRNPHAHLFRDTQESLTAHRESEERLRGYIENAPYGVFVADPDGCYVEVNRAACRMTGYTREELLSMAIDQLVSPGDGEAATKHFKAVREEGYAEGEVPFIRADGSERWWSVIAIRLSERRFLAYTEDITERKLAEAELARSKERFQKTIELSPVGIAIVDNKGNLTECNAAMADMVGYSQEELLALNFVDFTHPDDLEREWELINSLWDKETRQYRMEKRYIHKDGHIVWAEIAASIATGPEGFGFAFVKDITERKETEKVLEESEALLRQVIDLVPHLIFAKDRDGRFLLVNHAGAAFAGRTIEEMEGHLESEWVKDDDVLQYIQAEDQRVIESGEPIFIPEETFLDSSGQKHIVQTTKIPFVYQQGDAPGVLGISIDITAQKETEEALRESGARMRSIFRAAPIGIGLVSNRILLNVNDQLCTITGYSKDQLIGKDARMLYPDDEEYIYVGREKYRQIEKSGTGTVEASFVREDGRRIDVLLSSTPLDPDDLSAGVTFTVLDITDRKQAEELLRRHNRYLSALQETTLELISQFDLDTLLENIVHRAGALVGTTAGFLDLVDPETGRLEPRVGLGTLAESLQHPAEMGEGLAGIVWQSGQPVVVNDYDIWEDRIEEFSHGKVGSAIGVPLRSGREVQGVLGLAYDATSTRTFESEEIDLLTQFARLATIAIENARLLKQTHRDAETKALLLREVNHRVLNNLSAILSILRMEEQRSMDDLDNFKSALGDIASRIGSMATVHRMLSNAEWSPLDLRDVVIKVVRSALSGSPIQDNVEILLDAPKPVLVTSRQAVTVAIVINELTTNSAKYAFKGRSQGEIRIQVGLVDGKDGEEWVELVFSDDGPGLPDEVLAGTQDTIGLTLMQESIRHTLGGDVTLANDQGALASMTFKRDPL